MMRQPLVAGNWKMHGSRASARSLVDGVLGGMAQVRAAVAVCPPFVYLADVTALLVGTRLSLGAQNLSHEPQGAYTGEVSGAMLADMGCTYVIVGHSERRALQREDDVLVARKFFAARRVGLIPILCVGETLAEREAGDTESVIGRQLSAVLEAEGALVALAYAVIAYEPIWAIGTGCTASPEQAQEVHAFIRQKIAAHDNAVAENMRLLYGGSVKASNAQSLFAMPDIDGGLVGGASLEAGEFLAICGAAS